MSELQTESQNKKRGLGRGLGSLLGGPPPSAEAKPVESLNPTQSPVTQAPAAGSTAPMSEGKVWQVGIDKIQPGQYQPRQEFHKESLQELAQSIRENGILQPLTVRRNSKGQFELIAGERRWRAAQLAGLHEVPVLIRQYGDQQTLELSLIENIQREDLSPLEEAEAYARLSNEFHLSQQQIADKVGKDRATVANSIRLLSLPKGARELLSQGLLSVGHAKVLLGLQDPARLEVLAKRVVHEKIPVRKLEKLVAQEAESLAAPPSSEKKETPQMMEQLIGALSEELQKMLGTKVSIDYRSGRGQVKIAFYSNEELNGLVEKLKLGYRK